MKKTKYFIAITAAVFIFIIAMATILMQDTFAESEPTREAEKTIITN